jgi:hypothetical protein
MSIAREIKEGKQFVGIDEEPNFRLDVSAWGSSPSSPTVAVYEYDEDTETYTDVTGSVLTGTATANGDYISLPTFTPGEVGKVYRFDVGFTVGGSSLVAYAWVVVEQ